MRERERGREREGGGDSDFCKGPYIIHASLTAIAKSASATYRRTGFNCVVNDCVLVKIGQIANPIIAMDDPVPYCSIRARLCLRIY